MEKETLRKIIINLLNEKREHIRYGIVSNISFCDAMNTGNYEKALEIAAELELELQKTPIRQSISVIHSIF